MRPGALHFTTAWLSLLWFTLSSVLLSGRLVLCQDASGDLRIESICTRTQDGACQTRAPLIDTHDDHDDHDDHDTQRPPAHETSPQDPCTDTPLASDHELSRPSPSPTLHSIITPLALIASAFLQAAPLTRPGPVAVLQGPSRPPDALQSIRCIVLLV